MKRVVVFSPNRFSLYTIYMAELLRRNHVDIKAIVIRKLFNPSRFLSEFGRDGSRLFKKIWKKLDSAEEGIQECAARDHR